MSLNSKAKRLSLLAIACLAVSLPVTKSAKAATKLVEVPATEKFPGAIFETNCSYADGQTTVTGTMTLQERVEGDIPAGGAPRVGRIFTEEYASVSVTGHFLGISSDGNPIRYDIPKNTSVKCD